MLILNYSSLITINMVTNTIESYTSNINQIWLSVCPGGVQVYGVGNTLNGLGLVGKCSSTSKVVGIRFTLTVQAVTSNR